MIGIAYLFAPGLLSSSTYTLTTYVKVPFMPWMAGKEKRNEIVDFGWMLCVCVFVSVYLGLVSFFCYHHLTLDSWTWWEKHEKNISSFTALVLCWCNLRSFSQIRRQEKDEIVALGHSMLQLIEGAVNLVLQSTSLCVYGVRVQTSCMLLFSTWYGPQDATCGHSTLISLCSTSTSTTATMISAVVPAPY